MDNGPDPKPLYPAHGWGKLAENPWLQIGPRSEAYREVLRRIWRRQGGGGEALFDLLIPPEDAPKKVDRK